MDMRPFGKRMLLLFLSLCLLVLLSGCRTRTGSVTEHASAGESPAEEPAADVSGPLPGEEADAGENAVPDDSSGRTRENPEASRREYDENAEVEIVPGTERLVHTEGKGDGAPVPDEEAPEKVSRLNEQAEQPAVQTVPADRAEQKGVSEDAETADSAMAYFTVLLQDRTRSLFECQSLNVYWETEEDHVTIHKSSPEHDLILSAGTFDVSARLLPENLRVDDGWVVRKNPGVIVKVVGSDVLGNGVFSAGRAGDLARSLAARESWSGIDAVKANRVLLISREMLDAPYLRTAAALLIARTAYPEQFSDLDPDEALRMLSEEATGTLPAGILYYSPLEEGL